MCCCMIRIMSVFQVTCWGSHVDTAAGCPTIASTKWRQGQTRRRPEVQEGSAIAGGRRTKSASQTTRKARGSRMTRYRTTATEARRRATSASTPLCLALATTPKTNRIEPAIGQLRSRCRNRVTPSATGRGSQPSHAGSGMCRSWVNRRIVGHMKGHPLQRHRIHVDHFRPASMACGKMARA